jgi:hypothetical protein
MRNVNDCTFVETPHNNIHHVVSRTSVIKVVSVSLSLISSFVRRRRPFYFLLINPT